MKNSPELLVYKASAGSAVCLGGRRFGKNLYLGSRIYKIINTESPGLS